MSGNEITNIQVYRRKWNMNIGVFLFGVIFIYLVVTVLLYLTNKHVAPYEVREGSILRDTAYTGFIVRSETVIPAGSDGYVNYFVTEGSKVGAKTRVYTMSPGELTFKDSSDGEALDLSAEEQAAVLLKTQSFNEAFQEVRYADVYNLKNDITGILENKSSQSRQSQLDEMIAGGALEVSVHTAADDGVVQYSTDGYENITISDVTEDMISKKNYEKVSLKNNMEVKAGDPVYKLITSDVWYIAILLSDETAQELADKDEVEIRITKDNETAWADFAIFNTATANIGLLKLNSSMIRYAGERYLDIELILEDESGLKIPKTSVTKKDFYTVPEYYLTKGGNSKETGVLVHSGADNAQFQKVNVYYRDNETGMVYLDPNVFADKGEELIKPDSDETYKLGETKSLKGVYNINKGYAVFRQINILCESEEYYIVEAGNNYGLSNYDHIALDQKSVRENDVVF